jgi:hypothetical protein
VQSLIKPRDLTKDLLVHKVGSACFLGTPSSRSHVATTLLCPLMAERGVLGPSSIYKAPSHVLIEP